VRWRWECDRVVELLRDGPRGGAGRAAGTGCPEVRRNPRALQRGRRTQAGEPARRIRAAQPSPAPAARPPPPRRPSRSKIPPCGRASLGPSARQRSARHPPAMRAAVWCSPGPVPRARVGHVAGLQRGSNSPCSAAAPVVVPVLAVPEEEVRQPLDRPGPALSPTAASCAMPRLKRRSRVLPVQHQLQER